MQMAIAEPRNGERTRQMNALTVGDEDASMLTAKMIACVTMRINKLRANQSTHDDSLSCAERSGKMR
jgi:hypothetical protein